MPKPYQPRTPPCILIADLMELVKKEKKGVAMTMAMTFLEQMAGDLEELDSSPKFQELAESLRKRWNELAEARLAPAVSLQPIPPAPTASQAEAPVETIKPPAPPEPALSKRSLWRRLLER